MKDSIEFELVQLLKERKLTVATAESCTAGLVASTLVNAPGASEVFHEGLITYSNEAKQKYLHVKRETLEQFGAVSYETACEMAKGAAEVSGSACSISVTGIAGPDGGTPEKPVGLVYIGVSVCGEVYAARYQFSGTRREVREQSVKAALQLLMSRIPGQVER